MSPEQLEEIRADLSELLEDASDDAHRLVVAMHVGPLLELVDEQKSRLDEARAWLESYTPGTGTTREDALRELERVRRAIMR